MGDVSPPFNLVYMSGIASAIGGVISSGINYISNRETNKANLHLAELANQWSLDQWNRENAYNSPVAQVERLKAAGLNPAMMYGQGGIQNLAADSPAVTSAAGTQIPFQIDPLTAAQIASLASQTDKTDAEKKAIEDANKRANELQPGAVSKQNEEVEKLRTEMSEMRQSIDNMKMDEQLKSLVYLHKSLDYQFGQVTFHDAVSKVHQDLESAKLGNRFTRFQIDRAMQILPFELMGFDLGNKKLRSEIGLNWQQYSQSRDLFETIKQIKSAELEGLRKDNSLKQLKFWIDALDNYDAYKAGFEGWRPGVVDDFMRDALQRGKRLFSVFKIF